ncbi:CYTH domain-containing protein [Neisseriaceae bacterium TC5R-5]|nr:CYTH domain-containing protein [Neisseriaceae bacterium TC5R-5]
MALEIERRFLICNDHWRKLASGTRYRQGYLSVEKERTVRVRIVGEQAWLTLKGYISELSRHEFEYPIPLADAITMLDTMCPLVIEKLRYCIEHAGFVWEIDEFFGDNTGLVLAEIELPSEDTHFERPDWIGAEISQDGRYTNAYLSKTPYRQWPEHH